MPGVSDPLGDRPARGFPTETISANISMLPHRPGSLALLDNPTNRTVDQLHTVLKRQLDLDLLAIGFDRFCFDIKFPRYGAIGLSVADPHEDFQFPRGQTFGMLNACRFTRAAW